MQKLDDRYDIPGLSESDCDWLAHLLGTRRPVLQPIRVTEFGRQRRMLYPPAPKPLSRGETWRIAFFLLWSLVGLSCLAYVMGQAGLEIIKWLR